MPDITETKEQVDPAGHISTEIFGVVIYNLHVTGQLTDKTSIIRELKVWLPSVTEHELQRYTMCIWFTAKCFVQLQKGSTSDKTTAVNSTRTFTQAVDSDSSYYPDGFEFCAKVKLTKNSQLKHYMVPVADPERSRVNDRVHCKRENIYVSLVRLPYSSGKQKHRPTFSIVGIQFSVLRFNCEQHG